MAADRLARETEQARILADVLRAGAGRVAIEHHVPTIAELRGAGMISTIGVVQFVPHVGRESVAILPKHDGEACWICGGRFLAEDLQIEHIIPYSKGGGDEPTNLDLACVSCNSKKGARFVASSVRSRKVQFLTA